MGPNRNDLTRNAGTNRQTRHALPFVAALLVPVAAIVLTACSGKSSAAGAGVATAVPGLAMQTMTMPANQQAAAGPSEAAQMTCGVQTQASVGAALALRDLPTPASEWANNMFVCTYDLDAGPLVLTVKELADPLSAQRYYDGLRQHSGPSEPIDGLGSLGLPGYQTPSGVVVFVKDNMTLQVDATAMQEQIGPNLVSRTEFAYQIATNVLACWKAHH